MTRWKLNRYSLLCLLLMSMLGAQAKEVTLEVRPGIIAKADYRVSPENKQTVMILHGFLQTHHFSTVSRLTDSLFDAGFNVLAPTLSLNISQRKRSLPCEAIQDHSMPQTVDEVAQWVNWLKAQGHEQLSLIGHSSGSASLVVYLSEYDSSEIDKTVLISLTHNGHEGKMAFETEADGARAKQALANGNEGLATYGLTYCQQYTASPRDYLSYFEWDKQRTLSALEKMKTPLFIIIGSKDRRMDDNWIQQLKERDLNVLVVPGANHFFDQTHEFDLHDRVLSVLNNNEI